MQRTVRLAHKYLSLTMAALWLLQAVTGALLVFHWKLDDSGVSGSRLPLPGLAGGHFFICSDWTRRQLVLAATQPIESLGEHLTEFPRRY
jgi:hypothetical protein